MTTSKDHEFGTAEYWKKRAHTKQQIIDRQRNKITRLERRLAGAARQPSPAPNSSDDQGPQALADTPDQ